MTRLNHIRAAMRDNNLPALLVTKRENLLYLTGFSGSSGALVITEDRQLLISDFRYRLQAEEEAPESSFILSEGALATTTRQVLSDLGYATIGFEPADVTVAMFNHLGGNDPAVPYTLQPAPDIVENVRIVKDAGEIERIRKAVEIADQTYTHLTHMVKPGVTEHELALEAEWYMRRQGADGMSFDIIVATGDHSALPHAQPGERPLRVGDLVIIDMGARYARYCSDMTRTFAVAKATPIAQEIYRVCAEAQQAGVDRIQAGITGQEADRLVREVIDAAGYGTYFGHGTGHGVGLEIHESPRLNRESTQILPAGAAVTIEPGIYLPEVGGVRIEDLVVLTETGLDVLTAAPKPAELPVHG
ncbi:MAG: M24 family metallopeptidase [Armatimonadota bacterium]